MCLGTKPPQTTHHFEFWGPYLGPVAIIGGLPVVTVLLQWYVAIFTTGGAPETSWAGGARVVCCWLVGVIALHRWLPGKLANGVKLSTGHSLPYKLNGGNLVDLLSIRWLSEPVIYFNPVHRIPLLLRGDGSLHILELWPSTPGQSGLGC